MEALARWEETTWAFLSGQGWDPAGAHLLLAVSGGADSVALLRFWQRAASRLGCRVSAAHVNHRLRPSSSADRAFVAGLCRDLGVACRFRDLDPAAGPRGSPWKCGRAASATGSSRKRPGKRARTGSHRASARRHGGDRVPAPGPGHGPARPQGHPLPPGAERHPPLPEPQPEGDPRVPGNDRGGLARDESNADARIDRNWYRHRYLPALRLEEEGLDERVSPRP